jgi:hypothetical protein
MGYSLSVTGYGNLEKMPDYQNVGTTYDKFVSGSIRFYFRNLRASLGAVDYEKGFNWRVELAGTYVSEELHSKVHTEFDLGFPLPLGHSSLWLRNSIGYSPGERYNPFDNFYFGGFGNNWIDYLPIIRYRQYYSFPGVELNSIGGVNYGKAMVEMALPPLRFRKLGLGTFYATWARLNLFSSVIRTNLDKEELSRTVANAGVQLDIRFIMLSHHNITFSIGYTQAFEKDLKTIDEIMFSLKIL